MYCGPLVVISILLLTENLLFVHAGNSQNIGGDVSSEYLKIVKQRQTSLLNQSVTARSLLTCTMYGKRERKCIGVNYSKNNEICELLFGEIDDSPSGDGVGSWQNVVIRNSTGVSKNAAVVSSYCPAGYSLRHEGKCYKMVFDAIAMFTAVTRCKEDGGELVSVQSLEEQQFLCSYLSGGLQFWTSGTFDKGVPYWASTSLDFGYTNWNGAPPVDTANTAVYMDTSQPNCPWLTELFTAGKFFICEYPVTS